MSGVSSVSLVNRHGRLDLSHYYMRLSYYTRCRFYLKAGRTEELACYGRLPFYHSTAISLSSFLLLSLFFFFCNPPLLLFHGLFFSVLGASRHLFALIRPFSLSFFLLPFLSFWACYQRYDYCAIIITTTCSCATRTQNEAVPP